MKLVLIAGSLVTSNIVFGTQLKRLNLTWGTLIRIRFGAVYRWLRHNLYVNSAAPGHGLGVAVPVPVCVATVASHLLEVRPIAVRAAGSCLCRQEDHRMPPSNRQLNNGGGGKEGGSGRRTGRGNASAGGGKRGNSNSGGKRNRSGGGSGSGGSDGRTNSGRSTITKTKQKTNKRVIMVEKMGMRRGLEEG